MNPLQLGGFLPQQADLNPQSLLAPLSRPEKIESLLTQVLPTALSLGLTSAQGGAPNKLSPQGTTMLPAATSTAGGLISAGAPLASAPLGILGGIMGVANLALSWGRSTPAAGAANGLAIGATIGTFFAPGIGTAIGAAAGTLIGGLIGCIKGGKHRDQKVRDSVREHLVQQQILSSDYKISLADGSQYNIGMDGGPKAEFGGRRPFEVDFANPLSSYAVSWMNPIIDLLSQGNEKVKTDFVGYFANAATSNATTLDDVRANVNAIIAQFGVSDELLSQAIIQAANSGQLPIPTAQAYLSGIDERRDPEFNPDIQ